MCLFVRICVVTKDLQEKAVGFQMRHFWSVLMLPLVVSLKTLL